MSEENRVPEALAILKEAMEKDESYFISWQANLAMCFKDGFANNINKKTLHEIANDAAVEFINRLLKSNFERKL